MRIILDQSFISADNMSTFRKSKRYWILLLGRVFPFARDKEVGLVTLSRIN